MSRVLCGHCDRPLKTCLCSAIVVYQAPWELIILQDPLEARHALSSAPILRKSIVNSQLHVGDLFEPEALLGPNWRRDSLLLYPGKNAVNGEEAIAAGIRRMVLLDGTWRKVRRLIHRNAWLLELACLALSPAQGSRYRIRKSPRSDGLSTIEAAVMALNQLDPVVDYSPLLAAFDCMIELQIAAMGEVVYRRNHSPDD